ncbi:hypothetical protein D9M68_884130 [compost metagenome]
MVDLGGHNCTAFEAFRCGVVLGGFKCYESIEQSVVSFVYMLHASLANKRLNDVAVPYYLSGCMLCHQRTISGCEISKVMNSRSAFRWGTPSATTQLPGSSSPGCIALLFMNTSLLTSVAMKELPLYSITIRPIPCSSKAIVLLVAFK